MDLEILLKMATHVLPVPQLLWEFIAFRSILGVVAQEVAGKEVAGAMGYDVDT